VIFFDKKKGESIPFCIIYAVFVDYAGKLQQPLASAVCVSS